MLGLNHYLKMPRLRQNERERAVTYLLQGVSQSEVARCLGVHQSTINRLQMTGSTADQPRSGRPRVTTEHQDRRIRLLHLRDRFRTAVQTALETPGTHNNRIHPKTVRNRLKDFGLTAHRPYVGPPLTPRRRAVRMNWLQRHLQITSPVNAGDYFCFQTNQGLHCFALTAVNVSTDVEGSDMPMPASYNVTVLEEDLCWCGEVLPITLNQSWYLSMAVLQH